MPMHKPYEELCALAATGQITGDAMKILDQHVRDCPSCQAFLDDLVPLKAHVAPVVAGSRVPSFAPPDGMRERFLERAADAGLDLYPGRPVQTADQGNAFSPQHGRSFSEWPRIVRIRLLDWYEALPRYAVPVTVGLLCSMLGFVVAQRQSPSVPSHGAAITPAPPLSSPGTVPSAEVARLQQQDSDDRRQLTALAADLARVRTEKLQIEQELMQSAQRAAAGDEWDRRLQQATAQLQDANARNAKLMADLEADRNRLAAADAIAAAQQRATEDAQSTIATLQEQLEHARELDAGKQLAGGLISARNLHIVDVYDTESNGQRKRAFGRVFFVEGKSLVFYAYDLPGDKRPNKKIEFQVWGEEAGLNSVSVNLGSMRSDNSTQGRWVMTCDDPKVLNRINAVYLTATTNPQPDSRPRGTKLMYAFLGSPNHP